MEKIATPAKTRNLVKKYGFQVRKSLGQNFLIEPKFIEKIVAAAELDQSQLVVEIGPGMGALTQILAENAGHVIAVELDRDLISILGEVFADNSNITIIHQDVLQLDFNLVTAEIKEGRQFVPGFKVVANLPYYITTPVIMKILEGKYNWTTMVLMVQKEVAQRFMASPGTKDYGSLSVAVQYYCQPSLVTTVPRTVFFPRPEVESAVVKFVRREVPPAQVNSEKIFFALVKAAFAQRRKTLLNALTKAGPQKNKEEWQEILTYCRIDPLRRGETLNIEEFARLANYVSETLRGE